MPWPPTNSHPPRSPFLWKEEDKRRYGDPWLNTPFQGKGVASQTRGMPWPPTNSHPPRSPFLWKGEDKRRYGYPCLNTPFQGKGVASETRGDAEAVRKQPSPSIPLPPEGGRQPLSRASCCSTSRKAFHPTAPCS